MKYPDARNITYRIPVTEDFPAIIKLLSNCSLPASDISPDKQHLILAEHDGNIIGCAGIEAYGKVALFRSLAVSSKYRGLDIGKRLTGKGMALALEKGIRELYLLTTTADGFFKKQGWEVVDRKDVPPDITGSSEFATICPSTAICMKYTF